MGVEGTDAVEWAIKFSGIIFSNFLLVSGDFQKFVYTYKKILSIPDGDSIMYEVLQTSESQTPTTIEFKKISNLDHLSIGTYGSYAASESNNSLVYSENASASRN